MTLRPIMVLLVLLAGATLLVAVQHRRWATTISRLEAARQTLAAARGEAQTMADLKASRQQAGLAARPTEDVVRLIGEVLDGAGLASRHLQAVAPEADRIVTGRGGAGPGGAGYRRQSMRLTLEDLTVGDLGAFLDVWRTRTTLWTPERIDINHRNRASGRRSARRSSTDAEADDGRYDITLHISAIYFAQK